MVTEAKLSASAADQGIDAAFQEALDCARTLVEGGDAGPAADLLRCECAGAPAHALATVWHKVLEKYLQQGDVESAFKIVMELLSPGKSGAVLHASQEIVLRALIQTQQHARAAELLRVSCDVEVVPPGDGVFNSVVDAAVRARAYGEAWDVLELLLNHRRRADKYFVSILTKSLETSNDRRLMRRGIGLVNRFIEQQHEDVDEIVFNSLLNVLGQVGDMVKLRQTLNKMNEHCVPPSAVTYGTVVKAYGRARDIDSVLRVWHEMRSRCPGMNPVTCGCVLDACVKCGRTDKAMAIFQEMRPQGLHKNTVLYATLIKGLAKTRDLPSAVQLYREMCSEGVACNLVTFNSLMDVCVRCGDLQTAALFLQDMMKLGIRPDLITFSTLIKGYCHSGDVHKALALSVELKSRGLKCDEIVYNSLIDGCAKANKAQEGLQVFEDMLQSRVAPSDITFSILIKLHFEAGRAELAFRMLDEMSAKYHCAPSRCVYTSLFRCCAQHGGVALARGAALLADLAGKRKSKIPDQGMVGALVSGCVQHADFETAMRLARDFTTGGARHSSMVPLDCLDSLFEALGVHGDPRGWELLEEMRKKGLPAAHIAQLQVALSGQRRPTAISAPAGTPGRAMVEPGVVSFGQSGVAGGSIGTGLSGFSPAGATNTVQAMGLTPPQLLSTARPPVPSSLDQYYFLPQQAAYHHSPYVQPDFYQSYQTPSPHHMGYLGNDCGMLFAGGRDDPTLLAVPPPPPSLMGTSIPRILMDKENVAPATANRIKDDQDANRGNRGIPQKPQQKQRLPRDQGSTGTIRSVNALNSRARLRA